MGRKFLKIMANGVDLEADFWAYQVDDDVVLIFFTRTQGFVNLVNTQQ